MNIKLLWITGQISLCYNMLHSPEIQPVFVFDLEEVLPLVHPWFKHAYIGLDVMGGNLCSVWKTAFCTFV